MWEPKLMPTPALCNSTACRAGLIAAGPGGMAVTSASPAIFRAGLAVVSIPRSVILPTTPSQTAALGATVPTD